MPQRNWTTERVRANFRIDTFSAVCAGAYLGVVVAFVPVVVRRMGGSTFEVALVVAAPFLGHLLTPLFSYLFAGLRPVRVVAATGTVSRLIFLCGVLVATTPFLLALTSVVSWMIAIANIASYATLMQAIYPDSERAQAMGKVRIGSSLAAIVSATAAGLLIDAVPATIVFAAAALVSLPGALAFARIRHEPPPIPAPRRPVPVVAREIWSDRRYRRLLVAFSVFGFGNLMNAAVFPIMLVDHFNAPNTFVGVMAALQSGTMVVAFLAWGRFIDRGSSLRMSVVNTALVLLVPLGYLVAPSTLFLLPVAIVAGITNAGGDVMFFTNVVQIAPHGRVGEYAAAQSFLLGVRGTIAPFVASLLLVTVAPQAVLVLSITLMVTGLVMLDRAVRAVTPVPALEPAPA
ncbi:MAG TPA: MFS transporter [Candidatus Limnocylindria bacterium]